MAATPPADEPARTPITPPDLDEVRRLLRPNIAQLPEILAQWPEGEGPLADVPLLDPGMVAPRSFEQLSGTVRVAATSPDLVTMGGMLDLPDGGLLITAITVSPADLSTPPQDQTSRRTLAHVGATQDVIGVEVVALLSPLSDTGGPAAGVGIVRPLVVADPGNFPHVDDTVTYGADLRAAAATAVEEDCEVVSDLAGSVLVPLPGPIARIWSPIFLVGRAATVGLAARGAGGTAPRDPGND